MLSSNINPTNINAIVNASTPLGLNTANAGNGMTSPAKPQTSIPMIQTVAYGDPIHNIPIEITPYTALTLPAVYSAARFICETIAGLPKNVNKRLANNSRQHLLDHPIAYLMNDEINALQIPHTFWGTFILHAVIWSQAFAFISRDEATGEINGLLNLMPDRVTPFRYNGEQWFRYDMGKNEKPLFLASYEVLHLPAFSYDGMNGLPMIKLMNGSLRIGKGAEEFGARFFEADGHLGGTLETDGELTPEQIADLKLQISTKKGTGHSHKWMVLTQGLKAKSQVQPNDSAQYNETRTFSVVDVCRMLRVAPHHVYDLSRATWANVESLGIETVKYSLNNWIIPLQQESARKLLTPIERKAGVYIAYDVESLQRGNAVEQTDVSVKRVTNGLTTPDEERAKMELPAYPDGSGATARFPSKSIPLAPDPTATPAEEIPTPPADEETDMGRKGNPTPTNAVKRLPDAFTALVADAAERVGTKTAKAVEAAKKKHEGNPQAFTIWGNIFAGEQAAFSTMATTPLIQTLHCLSGETFDGKAEAIGAAYGLELRKYFAAITRGEAETFGTPNLETIIRGIING